MTDDVGRNGISMTSTFGLKFVAAAIPARGGRKRTGCKERIA
jgi:hypothetical protein